MGITRLEGLLAAAALAASLAVTGARAHAESHGSAKFDEAKAEETAFGRAADPAKAARTVHVAMADTMRFTPAQLSVKRGEAVRFVAANHGKVMHEMVLGTLDELRAHAEMMRKHPGMEHDEPHMLHVAPGKTGQMGWRFTRAGTFFYGCLVAGHFEAGMIGTITVTEK